MDPVLRRQIELPEDWDWRQYVPRGMTEDEALAWAWGQSRWIEEQRTKHAQAQAQEATESASITAEQTIQAKPFPLHVFPAWLQDFVQQGAESIVCPPDYVAAGALVVLGSALGTRRVIQIKPGWTEAACLWLAIVGRPGDAKSPALAVALEPVRGADGAAHIQWGRDLADWQQRKEAGEDVEDRPVREQYVVSDVTIESLAQVLQDNPRGVLLHRDEFAGWIRSMNVYRGGRGADVNDYCSMWSGEPINVTRKTTEGARVEKPFLSVLGGIQPDVIDDLSKGRDDGFADRLLLVYPRPIERRWSQVSLTDQARLAYAGHYNELLSLPPAEVPLAEDALARWVEWFDMFHGWLHRRVGAVRGVGAKMPRYCARFALILAHARGSYTRVELEDVEGAIELVNYFTRTTGSMADLLEAPVGGLDRDIRKAARAARAITEWLEKQEGRTATQRAIQRSKVGGVRKKRDVEEAVSLLLEEGRVKVETSPVGVGDEVTKTVTLL